MNELDLNLVWRFRKRIVVFLIISITTLLFIGCSQEPANQRQDEQKQRLPETFTTIVETERYEVYQNDSEYVYRIFSNDHEVVDEGRFRKIPTITEVGEHVLCLTFQTGTGRSTQYGFFYDYKTDIKSQEFTWILDCSEDTVILGNKDGVVVCSIFDQSEYIKLLPSHPVAQVADAIQDAKFNSDFSEIEVTYIKAGDFEVVTETIARDTGHGDGSVVS